MFGGTPDSRKTFWQRWYFLPDSIAWARDPEQHGAIVSLLSVVMRDTKQGRASALETSSASSFRQETNKWLVKSLSGLSLRAGYLIIQMSKKCSQNTHSGLLCVIELMHLVTSGDRILSRPSSQESNVIPLSVIFFKKLFFQRKLATGQENVGKDIRFLKLSSWGIAQTPPPSLVGTTFQSGELSPNSWPDS